MKHNQYVTRLYAIMTFGSAVGLVASFMQMMDKLTLLKDSGAVLACNVNSTLSCSTVLGAPQASVLGPPNALISTVMFCFFLAVGLVGLTGGVVSKRMRFITQSLSLFTLAFGFWFLMQSIFVIQSLCIYCIFNSFGLLLINGAWLRLNYADIKVHAKVNAVIKNLVANGFDILIWLIIAIFIIGAALFQFL